MSTWTNLGNGLWHGTAMPNQSSCFRFIWHESGEGRRTLCLGPEHEVSKADAKRLAAHARRLLDQGVDPLKQRQAALLYVKKHWDDFI